MSRYTYTLNRGAIVKESHHYYSRAELELMTTYQLREICRQEKIINGLYVPLDKDELIHQIMRFRGREDRLFITEEVQGGVERLEGLLRSAKLHLTTGAVRGCAKLTALTVSQSSTLITSRSAFILTLWIPMRFWSVETKCAPSLISVPLLEPPDSSISRNRPGWIAAKPV